MNRKLLPLGAIGLTAMLSAACHDHDNNPPVTPPPPPPTSQSLDTAQVLALAQHTSESDTPTAVNGGALTINDTSETSAPIPVSAN